MEEKRVARLLDENGNWVEVPIEDLETMPIVHEELPEELLKRIKKIYDEIREIYTGSLEHFEIAFMRDNTPENEVELWECIIDTYNIVKDMTLTDDNLAKSAILSSIVAISINALTKEEEERPEIKKIQKVFNTIAKRLKKKD